jgi:hypothetical protein
MNEPFEIKGMIFIGSDTIEFAVARVGDGWLEPTMEATFLMPELGKMKSITGNFDRHYESLTEILAQIRDQIFASYGMIPVQVLAGESVRSFDRRNELNWLIEEATGYRMVVMNENEESRYSIHSALQGNVLDESGFESLLDKIKKASETDAFYEK